MSNSKTPTIQVPTKSVAARQQVIVGFGIICLASLMFHAVMANLTSTNTEPFPDPNTVIIDPPIPSTSGLSKAQMQTILSSISELSDLIRESTASLHQNLDGIICTAGRKPQEIEGAVLAASLIGTLSAFVWAVGLGIFTDGLYKISDTLRNRTWGCGLLGANVGLAYMLAVPPENWVSYFSGTLWSMYVGLLGGLFSDRETFLAD